MQQMLEIRFGSYSLTVSTVSLSTCHEVMGPDAMTLVFWMLSLKPTFSLSSFTSSWGSLVLPCFLPYGWCYLHSYYSWKKMKVSQSCPTLCDPMDYRVHAILQARILEWIAFPFCRGSSQPRDWTQVSCIAGGFFTSWATGEAHALAISNLKIHRKKTILSHQNSSEN